MPNFCMYVYLLFHESWKLVYLVFVGQVEAEIHRRHDWSQSWENLPGSTLRDVQSGDFSGWVPDARHDIEEQDPEESDYDSKEAERTQHARMQGAVYIVGRSSVRCREEASLFRRSVTLPLLFPLAYISLSPIFYLSRLNGCMCLN